MNTFGLRRWWLKAFLVAALVFVCTPSQADYRVDVGDVVEIFVTGVPELQRRVVVRMDGTISFPLVGSLKVVRLSTSELHDRIQIALAGKIFQRKTPDGGQVDIIIGVDEVTADVVEFRPVYVNGEVMKPGEYVYRPSLIVRQAVIAAGGYSPVRGNTADPFVEATRLEAEFNSLWAEFVRAKAQAWGTRKLLRDGTPFDFSILAGGPITRNDAKEILAQESDLVVAIETDQQGRKDARARALKECNGEIRVLSELQQVEERSVADDAAELERALTLFDKGQILSQRVTDARRALLLSSSRRLETTSRLAQVRRTQVDLQSQLERLDSEQRVQLLRDLREATGRVAGLWAKIEGVMRARQHVLNGIGTPADLERTPQITIIRKGEKAGFSADEDTELYPGDVVQVSISPPKAVNVLVQ